MRKGGIFHHIVNSPGCQVSTFVGDGEEEGRLIDKLQPMVQCSFQERESDRHSLVTCKKKKIGGGMRDVSF
jgi:hypothetical protein